jgi:hypothetical protein
MSSVEDFLASANIAKATPMEKSIANAIVKEKLKNSNYAVPDKATIDGWISHFVPGIKSEYEKYFDALIAAAKAEGDPDAIAEHVAQKAVWQNWSSQNPSLQRVDLSKSGGKSLAELNAQADSVKKLLEDQTKVITDATAKTTSVADSLSGVDKTLSKDTKSYNAAQKNVAKAQKYLDTVSAAARPNANYIKAGQKNLGTAQEKLYGVNGTIDKPAEGSLAAKYASGKANQQVLSQTKKTGLSDLQKAIYSSLDTYVNKGFTPYSNFLTNTPTVDASGKALDANAEAVKKYVEEYKKTGNIPNGIDTAVVGQVMTEIDKYNQQKATDDAAAAAAARAKNNVADITKTRGDISNYNALLAEAAKKAPVVAAPTLDVLSKMKEVKGETTPRMGLPELTKYVGGSQPALGTSAAPTLTKHAPVSYAPPTPPVTQKSTVPQLGLNLSNDYNTRNIQQDLAAQQQIKNPGTYATGQFDPFYSSYVDAASRWSQPDAAFRPAPPSVGLGFQNMFDPTYVPTTTPPVTAAAAGGYLDAQSVGQNNQALQMQQPQQQNNQLGLASIPNMSQYTNYTNNPGMTSPTQNTDDGGIGGISVLGQTNPVW